jgi:hypothetical protein
MPPGNRDVVMPGVPHQAAAPTGGAPEFIPWSLEGEKSEARQTIPPPVGPREAGSPPEAGYPPEIVAPPETGRAARPVLLALAAVAALMLFVVVGLAMFGGGAEGAQAASVVPVTGIVTFVVVAVLLVVASAVAIIVVRNHQAGRARAEANRDLAIERAQLLAAAMDPETAMRLLGYDDRNDRPEP